MPNHAVRILLTGTVQGCGVRPALARLAAQQNWSGLVRNTTAGVELILSGNLPTTKTLDSMIRSALPRQATSTELTFSSCSTFGGTGFHIEQSDSTGLLAVPIPRDVAICHECLTEIRDPSNRRFAYPFTSCDQCGPRYSLLLSMPFDRERTTMRAFGLCDQCRSEYENPTDRRFHAQTICCPECGPQVWATDSRGHRIASRGDAIRHAAEALRTGLIVAVRGIGGYQLLADATSSQVVMELRRRKLRLAKPFAVMCRTINEARNFAVCGEIELQQLCSPQNPIVLVRQHRDCQLAAEVNPGLNDIGLLLPTTALHDRLAELSGRPLICTSGNREGEPLASSVDESLHRLHEIADVFLHHDREISQPIDDSVVRVIANRPVTVRCARGLAPLPLPLSHSANGLAVGGHQKSAVAVSNGRHSLLGPHVGQLDSLATQQYWNERVLQLVEQANCAVPTRDVPAFHDAHPDYFPTRWCESHSSTRGAIWHHHAHIVAGLLEHGWLDRTVLGVAFDGTGLGPDGSIWGGEFLIATASHFRRVGHLRPFSLPGGEAAITDLRRLAVSMLSHLEEFAIDEIAELTGISQIDALRIQQAARSTFSPRTTSCGRLFDAAACLILRQSHSAYEGHPAMSLEATCDVTERGRYSFGIGTSQPIELDWRPVLRQILADRTCGIAPSVMAMRFHLALADAIRTLCSQWPDLPVVLGGGVFQNRVLVELLSDSWSDARAPLGLPGFIPPNDGGLAAGQLAIAGQLDKERDRAQCALESPAALPSGSTVTR